RLLLRLLDRDAVLQSREYLDPARGALRAHAKLRQRQPQVLILGKLELHGHDADEGVRPRVYLDRAPDDGGIRVVAAVPQLVGDEDDGFGALAIVFRAEAASDLW